MGKKLISLRKLERQAIVAALNAYQGNFLEADTRKALADLADRLGEPPAPPSRQQEIRVAARALIGVIRKQWSGSYAYRQRSLEAAAAILEGAL